MVREPDRITHTYELSDEDLHNAVRAYLGIPQEHISRIDWNAYGCTADAEVRVTIPTKKQETE